MGYQTVKGDSFSDLSIDKVRYTIECSIQRHWSKTLKLPANSTQQSANVIAYALNDRTETGRAHITA